MSSQSNSFSICWNILILAGKEMCSKTGNSQWQQKAWKVQMWCSNWRMFEILESHFIPDQNFYQDVELLFLKLVCYNNICCTNHSIYFLGLLWMCRLMFTAKGNNYLSCIMFINLNTVSDIILLRSMLHLLPHQFLFCCFSKNHLLLFSKCTP